MRRKPKRYKSVNSMVKDISSKKFYKEYIKKPKKIRCVWLSGRYGWILRLLEEYCLVAIIPQKHLIWRITGYIVAPYGTPKRMMEEYAKRYFK